jgi:hypothetical protein
VVVTPTNNCLSGRLQGSSATLRLGGNARFVTLVGLGKKGAATGEVKPWGSSSFQAAGVAIAAACKSFKCKSAAFVAAGEGAAMVAEVCCLLTLVSFVGATLGHPWSTHMRWHCQRGTLTSIFACRACKVSLRT